MSKFVCPICESELRKENRQYCCLNHHSFDLAKEGYVNLMPSNKKKSKVPGDSKEMIDARREFLDKDHYHNLCVKIIESIDQHVSESIQTFDILDAGCGEGYYIDNIEKQINISRDVQVYAFDVAKEAIRLAAKRNKDINYFVASSFSLPLQNDSFDFIISVFSPIAHEEFHRVIKPGGKLIVASPGPMHLYELKEELYAEPYQNKLKHQHQHFTLLTSEEVRYSLHLKSNEEIQSLLKMTPYYWKTSKERIQKVFDELNELEVTIAFDLSIYETTKKC